MKIYNTLKRQKETLAPIAPPQIKMYTCGQTVYNDIHIGNARFYVVFDAIRRYLAHKGYDVNYVQNFTDIDDKIIQKAWDENCTAEEIAERYIAHTLEDLDALNCLPATKNPRATEEIPEIIDLIQQLIEKGFAYENAGTVYYDVVKFEGYGKLSRKNIDDLEAGARVEVESGKKNPTDFVLWKPAKTDEPFWESPWGNGRPGWHIECSAMARKYLGDEIDIHGGGSDLIFPHHENEIAQTEAITGKNFARCWMHCGSLTTDHKKMSKSRGNFFTLREVAEKYSYDIIRFYLLSGHYRMPMEFTDTVMVAAAQGLQRIKTCCANLRNAADKTGPDTTEDMSLFKEAESSAIRAFESAMEDDFNTANAVTAIFELVKFANTHMADTTKHTKNFYDGLLNTIGHLCEILGLQITASEENAGGEDAEIEALIEARQAARKSKNFAESDRIRDELTKMGIILEDTPDGVRWRRG
ncbi:MAG: cysteine--tRNA ligase [Defluviitaleaceae bacterium]|nr:cysteine--tRNA ligase [Defluviitaleaceae bacterium]